MNKNYYAVIDIGSNTMRLVIYLQEKTGRFHEKENVKAVARLRNHLDSENNLTEEGTEILLKTLHNFSEILASYPLKNFICVATATIRQANNQQKLKQLVKNELDWEMRILSGDEEAFYGYLAVVNSTSLTEGITIDIGGGSTEITYFKNRKLVHAYSFSFGTLTLRSYLKSDRSLDENLNYLRQFLLEQFESLSWIVDKHVPIIGIGGSARNLAQIDQNQKEYPMAGLHQYQMDESDIIRISEYLTSLSFEQLQKVEGLSKDRADIIIPAIETFRCLYKTVHAEGFILSQKGLRDGLNYQFLFSEQSDMLIPNVLEDSIQELITDYDLNTKQMLHVQFLTRKLFEHLIGERLKGVTKQDWQLLKRASYVFHLGAYIDAESSAQHSFYLLSNRTIDGLMHEDRLKIALIASFKNKTTFKQFIKPYKNWFTKHEQNKYLLLGALLKLTYCFDATKRQVVKDFDVKNNSESVQITLFCNKNYMSESYQSEKQKKHLEKALNKNIILDFVKHN